MIWAQGIAKGENRSIVLYWYQARDRAVVVAAAAPATDLGALQTSTRLDKASTRRFGASSPTTMVVFSANASAINCADNGVRAFASRMMRLGCLNFRCRPLLSRSVRLGSSANTVLIPTNIASAPHLSFIP
jgi:hypothetical protein